MDNNEERMVIPHGPAAENGSNETPNKASDFSSDQDSNTQSTQSTPKPITDTVISHEEPIEQPSTAPSDTEPVDIFATPEERAAEPTAITGSSTHVNNTPFNSRNRYQEQSRNKFNNVPQFFSDAISASTPIEQPKSKKKGLFIGIAIGGVLLIGTTLIIIAILTTNRTPQGVITSLYGKQLNVDSKGLFYQYANKLLYDSTSSEPISGSYDSQKEYSYMTKIIIDSDYNDNSSYDIKYLGELSEAYTKFKEDFFNKNEMIDNNYAKNRIADYGELLEYFKEDPREMLSSDEVIMDAYLANGLNSAKGKTQQLLDKKSDNSYLSELYEIKKASIQTSLKMITKYDANNCTKNGTLVYSCVNKITVERKDDESITHIASDLDNRAVSLADNNYSQLAIRCWEIKQILEGK